MFTPLEAIHIVEVVIGRMPQARIVLPASRVLLAIALIAPAMAQTLLTGAPAAATGPSLDVSAGYSYLAMQVPGEGEVNLGGVDASGTIDFTRRWGAVVDGSYVRGSDVFGTGYNSYVLSALVGPSFYPFGRRTSSFFVRALGGAGLVDSAVSETDSSGYVHGWVARPAFAVGAGLEHCLPGPFALRVNADYLRTAFANSAEVIRLQNNLRVTASIVFRLRTDGNLGSR
jgi:hypothetical protein